MKKLRLVAYLAGFFLTLHLALPVYIGSSFLSQYMGAGSVGAIYIIASGLGILTLATLPQIVRRNGIKFSNLWLIVAEALAFLILIYFNSPLAVIAAFIAISALTLALRFNLDLLLEEASSDRTAGETRGIFLTLSNVAWVVSPIIAGHLTQNNQYNRVYFLSLLMLLPLFYLQKKHLQEPYSTERPRFSILAELKKLWLARRGRRLDIFKILSLEFLLNFFYAIMVIYTPIYLHQHVGLSWPQIGLVFSVMLLPFLLLQWPLGRLADRLLGEKEILTAGLIIMSLATLIIPWVETQKVWLWALLLFSTRIGAASMEIMKESYLFKQISGADSAILSLSRSTYPLAYVFAPLLVTLFVIFFPFKHIFTALGLLLLLGLPYSLTLKDTR